MLRRILYRPGRWLGLYLEVRPEHITAVSDAARQRFSPVRADALIRGSDLAALAAKPCILIRRHPGHVAGECRQDSAADTS